MAVPLQYQSQFIPTNFGVSGNILGMLRQDMQQRNQQYDQALLSRNKALSSLYGLETLDPDVIKQNVDALSQKIDEAVKNRGMDYGAAAGEISNLIAKEAANPIYKLNQRKLEQAKLLDQALARNPNLMVLQDPRHQTLSQNLSPEDIGYSVFDPSQVDQAINNLYGDLAKQRREGNPTYDPKSGYNVATTTLGLTPQEVQQMQKNPEVYQNILSNFPQLQQHLQNPEVANMLNQRIAQGLQGLSLGQQKQFLRPLTPSGSTGKLSDSSAIGSLYTPMPETSSKTYSKADSAFKDISSIAGSDGSINQPKVQRSTVTAPGNPMYGFATSVQRDYKTSEQKAYDKFKDYKNEYPTLYKHIKSTDGTDMDFLNQVTDIEKNKAYILDSRIGFNDPNFTKNVVQNFDYNQSQFFKYKDGKKTNSSIDLADFTKKFKDTGLTYKDSKIFLSPKGEVIAQTPDGNEYVVNKQSFPTVTRDYLNKLGNIFDNFYDYALNDKQVEEINKSHYNLGNNVYVGIRIPKNDVMHKQLLLSYPDSQTGQQTTASFDSPDKFYGYMSQLINADVFRGKK